jgi:chemotaxis protein MotB
MTSPKPIFLIMIVACLSLALLTGCVSKGKYNGVVQELDQMTQERDKLAAQKDVTTEERDDLAVVAADQEAELNAMQADYDRLIAMFAMEIESNDLKVKMLVNGIELAIPSDVLYASGEAKATVGGEGMDQAKKIAEFLAATEYFISVVGHTDNQQPSAKLAERFPTNWDLAAARASNAVKFFVTQGVEPTRIVATSRGEFDPVATNDTPEGRAQNRRIQIILRKLPE